MANERQIAANRANAIKSTGPRSEEGKSACRRNALKHGLAAVAVNIDVNDPGRAEAYADRLDAWEAEVRPRSEKARWSLGRAVAATFQIESCEADFDALAVQQTARARLSWDDDRRAEAADLGAGLHRNPTRVARRLATTRQGAEYLIERWERLGEAIEAEGGWGEPERSSALDLLGVPAELRQGRTPVDRADGTDPSAYRRELVRRQVDRLQSRIDTSLAALDDLARGHAELGALLPLTGPAQLLLRYQRDAWRRFHAAIKAAEAPSPESDDEAEDEPEPEEADEAHEPEPAGLPTTREEIRPYLEALARRVESASTEPEQRAARVALHEALTMFGPELGIKLPEEEEVTAAPHLNRHARRALAAQSRRA